MAAAAIQTLHKGPFHSTPRESTKGSCVHPSKLQRRTPVVNWPEASARHTVPCFFVCHGTSLVDSCAMRIHMFAKVPVAFHAAEFVGDTVECHSACPSGSAPIHNMRFADME